MLYFDTSFLAPLVLPETTSEAIAAFFEDLDSGQLAVSHWTRVEFSSLLARQVRMGGLDGQAAAQAEIRFEDMLSSAVSVILPMADDFSLAKQHLGKFETGLRAGDALHLAIARNHGAEKIFSLDKALIKAGNLLGLPMSMGIQMK